VLRARHGITSRELSKLSGLVSTWITAAEIGDVDASPLVAWWQRYLRALHRSYTDPPVPQGPGWGVLRMAPAQDLKARPKRRSTTPPE
jgi:hypothetical protein